MTSKNYFIFLKDFLSCGVGQGGGSPGEQGREPGRTGAGEGGKREQKLLGIILSKTLIMLTKY